MKIPIASEIIYDWQGPSAGVTFRVVANQTFLARDDDDSGFQVDANPKVFREVDCVVGTAVVNGLTVKTITIPTLWLFSTTDAIVNRLARYSAYFYTKSGGKIKNVDLLQNFQLPASIIQVFNPVPWKEIIRYNNPASPIPFDISTFSREQILEIIGGGSLIKGPDAAVPRVAFFSGPITVDGAVNFEYQNADPQITVRPRNTSWNTFRVAESAGSSNLKPNNKPSLLVSHTVNHSTMWNESYINDAATHRWGFSLRDGATGIHLEGYTSAPALVQGFRFDPSGGLGIYDEQDAGVGFLYKGATGFFHLGIEAAGGAASSATKEITFTTAGVGINKPSSIGSQLHVVSGATGRVGFLVDTAASPSQPIAVLRNNTSNRFVFNHDAVATFGLASSVKGKIAFAAANNANIQTIEAADTPASNIFYKLPATDPSAGQLLRTLSFGGGVAVLEWVNPTAGGDVSSDIGTVVDNKLARFNGTTGKLITDSAITVADTSGSFTVPDAWTVTNTGGATRVLNATTQSFTVPTGSGAGPLFGFTAASQTQSSGVVEVGKFSTTYNQTSTAGSTDISIARTHTAIGSGEHNFIKGFVGGTAQFRINSAGNYFFGATAGFLGDENGNEYLKFATVASAVNEINISNAATGNRPKLSLSGGDTNIGIEIVGKGTGDILFSSNLLITKDSPAIVLSDNVGGSGTDFLINFNGGATNIGRSGQSDLVLTNTSGVYTFGQIPVGPASSCTTANQYARKQYVDDRVTYFVMTYKVDDPSTMSTGTSAVLPVTRIPHFTGAFMTKIHAIFMSGSHTSGGDIEFMFQNGFGDVASIHLNNTNNTIFTFYTNDFSDSSLSESSAISVYLKTRTGTITERDVDIILEGFQKVG